MKKMLALGLALVMSVGMLSGCSTGGDTPSTDPGTSVSDENGGNAGNDGDTGESNGGESTGGSKEIVVNITSEPPEMNSVLTTSTGSMNVLRHIVEGLTILDQSDEAIPGVAESWEVSEDGLTYTFHLRSDSTWSNGDPVTANDFIFAWDTHFTAETAAEYAATWAALILGATEKLEGETPSADVQAQLSELGYDTVGYKAVDDYTIQITTTGPYPYFLSVLAFPSFMPINESVYTQVGGDQYGTEAEYILTNGPYNMDSWVHESQIILTKNTNYHSASDIKIDKITMEMISDTGTSYNTYLAGDIDMIELNGEQSAQLRDSGVNILSYDDGSCWYFEYNTNQPGLNNSKVRKALTLAIDAEAFINNLVRNQSVVANSFTPPAINNGTFTAAVGKLIDRVEDDDYTEVLALFEEGLAEEGMTIDDLNIAIITDDTDTAARYSAFFQEQWNVHLGAQVVVEQMTYKNRLDRMTNKDFSVVMAGWGPDYNDPVTFMDLWTSGNGNNHTSWANDEYDRLINAAISEVDATVRQNLLIDAEKLLMDEMPIGPIYNRKRDYVCSDKLTGVVRTAFDDMNFRWADVVE